MKGTVKHFGYNDTPLGHSPWGLLNPCFSSWKVLSWGKKNLPRISQWCRMSIMVSSITGNSTVCLIAWSSWQQRQYHSSALLCLCEGNQRLPVDYPHKGPVMWKAFPSHKDVSRAHWNTLGFQEYTQGWFQARLAPSQWETLLQSNAVFHWLGTNL